MHCAPSAFRLVEETQVEFVCASRGGYFRIAEFLEERYLAVYTDGGNYRRYRSVDDVLGLHKYVTRSMRAHVREGEFRAYLILADIGRGFPVVQCAVPKIKL